MLGHRQFLQDMRYTRTHRSVALRCNHSVCEKRKGPPDGGPFYSMASPRVPEPLFFCLLNPQVMGLAFFGEPSRRAGQVRVIEYNPD